MNFGFLKKNLVVLCESVFVVIPVVGYGAASEAVPEMYQLSMKEEP